MPPPEEVSKHTQPGSALEHTKKLPQVAPMHSGCGSGPVVVLVPGLGEPAALAGTARLVRIGAVHAMPAAIAPFFSASRRDVPLKNPSSAITHPPRSELSRVDPTTGFLIDPPWSSTLGGIATKRFCATHPNECVPRL
jgi:hypothetical protein